MEMNQFEFNLTLQEALTIKNALSHITYDAHGGDEYIFNIRKIAYQ